MVPPPSPPTGVTARPVATKSGQVEVNWTPPEDLAADLVPSTTYEVTALPTLTLHSPATAPFRVAGLEAGATYTFEVRTVTPGGKSQPASSEPVQVPAALISPTWRRTSWGFVLVALAGVIAFSWLWAMKVGDRETAKCLAFACAVLFVISVALTLTGDRFGMWRMIVGQDRRVSTSYLQTTLWTGLVAFILAYFTARTWFDRETGLFQGLGPGGTSTSAWDDYLVLLGGPFAALVFARGIVSSKVQAGTIQKTIADDGTASLKQALTRDDNNMDLVDSQYLIFNLVAFIYVVVALASTNRLPAIPGLLMALTGSAAATYVLNKAVQTNAPGVTAVIPATMRTGDRIVIEGKNFLPDGPDAVPSITIGGTPAIVEAVATSSRLTAIVPPGIPTGPQDLVVTTAAKVATDHVRVQVLEDKPAIIGVSPGSLHPNDDISIDGFGFAGELDGTKNITVHFGDSAVPGTAVRQPSGVQRVTVQVPANVLAANVPVTEVGVSISSPRLTTSDPVKVKFTAP